MIGNYKLTLCFTLLFAICSCHSAQTTQERERQAKIEKELEGLKNNAAGWRRHALYELGELKAKEYVKDISELLKDEDSSVRDNAVCTLKVLEAKEYTKDIAELLRDKSSYVRGRAVWDLGKLGAKEYADEIGKLINDSSECITWDEAIKFLAETTVSAEAERVLKEWGYDVEKLKKGNGKEQK